MAPVDRPGRGSDARPRGRSAGSSPPKSNAPTGLAPSGRILVRTAPILAVPGARATLRRILAAAGGSRTAAIVALAARQLGIVARWQLIGLDLSSEAVASQIRRGQLHRVFNGVYLLGHPVAPAGARELAALLAAGPGAVLSTMTAAAWHGIAAAAPAVVELSAARSYGTTRAGIRVHRSRDLTPADICIARGLPVTSPVRTIVDLAAAGHRELERVVSDAHARRLVAVAELQRAIIARAGRPGIERLREIAGAESHGYTRSRAERRMRALCRDACLPQPRTNARICGWEVDFVWPEARLVIEIDGYGTHGHRAQFERDRRKQADLVAHGYPVVRFTWRQLTREPLAVIAAIARALGAAQ